jgi:hypothetical protein
MPIQSTLRRPQSFASGRARRIAQRVNGPMIGQSFDIEISRDADGWMIRIPEIGGTTRATRRAAVELAARESIAMLTGIPIGYVAVFVARETS